jgi:hypothetical protein
MKEEFEKELQQLSPFLADLKKQQKQEPFKTPRLYFDTLADKVLEKVKEEKNLSVIIPPQYPSLLSRINSWFSTIIQPRLALATMGLALVVAAGWYVIRQQTSNIPTPNTPSVVETETPKNPAAETHNNNDNGINNKDITIKQPIIESTNESKTKDKKIDIVDHQALPKVLETTKASGITHPKSGLTEEEIEEYLNEALDDDDLEDIGGKL